MKNRKLFTYLPPKRKECLKKCKSLKSLLSIQNPPLCSSRGSPGKQNQVKVIYYAELSWDIIKVEKSAICKLETRESWWCDSIQVWRPENQESWWYKSQSKGRKRPASQLSKQEAKKDIFFLLPRFSSFQVLADWVMATPIRKANHFTKPTDSNANLNRKHPPRHTQK